MTLGAYVDVLHALYVDFHASALVSKATVQAGFEALLADEPEVDERDLEGQQAMLALAGVE